MSPNVLYVECHKILGFDKIKFWMIKIMTKEWKSKCHFKYHYIVKIKSFLIIIYSMIFPG